MDHTAFLEKLGLSAHESVVYLSLLKEGESGVSEIARKTGLYRTMIYQALAGLVREGLVNTTLKGKYKTYSAESPRRLEKKFLELSNSFDEEIKALTHLQAAPEAVRPIVKYFEGQKGIVRIHDDVVETLKKGETYYRYSSSNAHRSLDSKKNYLSKKYRLMRDQKQLERKVITNIPNKESKDVRLEREIKVVPADFDLFEYSISQVIYGNKVAVIDYNTETAVVIENATIAKFQQKIFELLFRKL